MNFKSITEFINKITSKKNMYNLVIVFLVGVLMVVISNFFKDTSAATATMSTPEQEINSQQVDSSDNTTASENEKEEELKSILSSMEGVGRVKVMIQFEGGEELVPAVNINGGTSVTNETDSEGGKRETKQDNNGETVVMTSKGDSSEPLIVQRISPKITGVIVVAEGAKDYKVRTDIVRAVSGVFGIPNYKVNVYPMNN